MTALTITGRWNAARKCVDVDSIFWEDVTMSDGAEVTAVLSDDPNPEALKFYWWFLGKIIDAGYFEGSKDNLDDFTRVATGFGKWRALSDGRAVFIPNSISLSKCGGRALSRYMWAAERVWTERLGVDVDAIKREASAAQRNERAAA